MANAWYAKGLQNFAEGNIAFLTANIKAVLTDHGAATPNVSTHDALDDISAGTIATSGNMASKTTTDGVLDVADFSFTAVSGATVESITWYKDSGTASTSYLFVYVDTATGLPATPGGGDINVTIDNGSNKLAKL